VVGAAMSQPGPGKFFPFSCLSSILVDIFSKVQYLFKALCRSSRPKILLVSSE
jgi:hypothetical protein